MRKKYQRVHRPERDRAVFAVLRSICGINDADVAQRAGVSPGTIHKWRMQVKDGGTRHPQFFTLNCVAKAFGKEFRLCDVEETARKPGYAAESRVLQ